jgi:tetratricopeptide (TPR) repeat protein
VEATPGPLTAQSSRYRAALGHALLQSQTKAAPKDNKSSRLPPMDGKADPARVLAVLVSLMLQPPGGSPSAEANALADELINAPPGTVPFDVLSQAYVIRGEYTKALKTYAEGLKASKELKPEYANGLLLLIDTHPILRRTESRNVANPLNAEKHFGAGLRWYWERNYANAETEFLAAVTDDGLDARYHYFLGLARLAQNKQEALEDFAQGAKLEAQERPSRAAVSAALERIQGPMRDKLNEARRQAAH